MEQIEKPVNKHVRLAIRRIRIAKGLRLQDVAAKSGIPAGSYACLELGYYRLSSDKLLRILLALETDIRDVWPGLKLKPEEEVSDEDLDEQLEESRPRQVGVEDVVQAVCRAFGVSPENLAGPSSQRRLSIPRAAAALLIREAPHLRMIDLAGRLGRDPSWLSHLLKRVEAIEHSEGFLSRVERARENLERRETRG